MVEANVKKVVDEHIKKFGGLDILVNNASKQMMVDDIADIKVSLLNQRTFIWSDG